MSYIEINDADWKVFEDTYSIPRTEMVEVNNIFRHRCRLFVVKVDARLWKFMINDMKGFRDIGNEEITYYHYAENKWFKSIMTRSHYM